MEDLSFLVNPRKRGKRKGGKRGKRKAIRHNPELMLMNAGKKRHYKRTRKHMRRNPGMEDLAINPKKLSEQIRAQIKSMKHKKHAKRKTIANKLHISVASVSKYAGKHRKKKRYFGKKKKRKGGKKKGHKGAGKKVGRKKGHKKGKSRKGKRFGNVIRQTKTVYVPIKISRGRSKKGKRILFKVNPAGLKDVQPMLVQAAWTALGFIGARLAGNFLQKFLPGFLKNDLIAHAIAPVALTMLPIKLPNKGNLLAGAYVAWVLKAANMILPASIKGYLGQYYSYAPAGDQYWFEQDSGWDAFPTYPAWSTAAFAPSGTQTMLGGYHNAHGVMGRSWVNGLGTYTHPGLDRYDPQTGLGVYGQTNPTSAVPLYVGSGDQPWSSPQFGDIGDGFADADDSDVEPDSGYDSEDVG